MGAGIKLVWVGDVSFSRFDLSFFLLIFIGKEGRQAGRKPYKVCLKILIMAPIFAGV